jgi:cyclase
MVSCGEGVVWFEEAKMPVKRKSWRRWLPALFAVLAAALPQHARAERTVTKLAEGVYEIQHEPNGNTTVIIGDRQVFVVDTCFLPSAAREDLAQIRQWTNKPVSFVLNSHFHNDHNFGNRIYMDAFPAVTVIAHVETKKEMDLFGPGSARREGQTAIDYQKMLDSGKAPDGSALTDEDRAQVKKAITRVLAHTDELKAVTFQSATLTFDHDFTIDLGHREVQVKFLGRGNTGGDAVVYLPKEKIVITGDLVVAPIPYIYDGYPTEWVQTLQNLAQLEAGTIVPGHGPVMHDKAQIILIRDYLQSAVEQLNVKLGQTSPAMFQTLDDVKGSVDLTAFRARFIGDDKDLGDAFDDASAHLLKVVFEEASLR